MNNIDVKECITNNLKKSDLVYPAINSTAAFNRLMALRKVRKDLVNEINANVESMPQYTRELYDSVIYLMKKIEIEEGQAIALGE